MKRVLPLLIEQAGAARDRQSLAVAQAGRAVQQAQATLDRLQDFRGECLARAPNARPGVADAGALDGYQQFVARLDHAIGVQGGEAALRGAQLDEQRTRLAACQQRLLAFEALLARQQRQSQARQARREQRDSDAFAARAAARAKGGA